MTRRRAAALCALLVALARAQNSVSIVVRNLSGRTVRVFWLAPGPEPRARHEQTPKPIANASQTSINSYHTHEFIIVAEPEARGAFGGAPAKETSASFAVGQDDEFFVLDDAFALARIGTKFAIAQSERLRLCLSADRR